MVSANLAAWLQEPMAAPSHGIDLPSVTDSEREHALRGEAPVLIREVEWGGATIALEDGRPVLRRGSAALDPSVLEHLRAHRRDIAIVLDCWAKGWMPAPSVTAEEDQPLPVVIDPVTGKMKLTGEAAPARLKEAGWDWSQSRNRWMAPYPHDVDDPTPDLFVPCSRRVCDVV